MVTPPYRHRPGGVDTQLEIWLTGQLPQRAMDGTWKYTSTAAAREAAGFLTMEEYVRRRQNMVAQYIAIQSLLDLYEGSDRDTGV